MSESELWSMALDDLQALVAERRRLRDKAARALLDAEGAVSYPLEVLCSRVAREVNLTMIAGPLQFNAHTDSTSGRVSQARS
jgi:hypothetical protein